MWSSPVSAPERARSLAPQLVSASPSRCTENQKPLPADVWLLHINPILLSSKAISDDNSSLVVVVPFTAGTNGVPQCRSSPIERFTYGRLPWIHVAHNLPLESLSITTDLDL